MDQPLIALVISVSALVVLSIAAMRQGADSRTLRNDRPNW